MANIIKVCPQCGNYVEGKRVQSYGKKLAKTGAKGVGGEVTGDVIKGGSTAAGAAIGSVVPGVGTLVGAGVGYLVGLAGKALVNDTIDSTIDAVTSEEYEFTCPRCGHTWTSNDTDYSVEIDEDEEYDAPDDDDYDNNEYDPEFDRFDSFYKSYVNDEYKNMDVEKQAEMFEREGNMCSQDIYKSWYYYLAALSRVEYFVNEWFENDFKNHLHEQQKLRMICLQKGSEDMKICRGLCPETSNNAVEFRFFDNFIRMLVDFWVDSDWNPKTYDTWGDKLFSIKLEEKKCIINPKFLIQLAISSLSRIENYVKPSASGTSNDELSAEEQEYLNEYKEMLADGEISDRDRRYLNKIMNANGISAARAKELEAMASSPSLTDEEQEYLNEYRDMISDGEISPRDQRFLDKLKKTNGISDARAKELEAMA